MKILSYLAIGIGIAATIIGIWDFNLAIEIIVKAIIVACFVGLLITVASGKN